MYFEKLTTGFLEVDQASEKGMEELLDLAERCYARLSDMLDDDGNIILEQYTACLNLLNDKQRFENKKIF